jgi:SecD/SecF fusion protein
MKDTRDSLPTSTLRRRLLIALAAVAFSFVGSESRHRVLAATEQEHVILIYEVDPVSLTKGEKIDMDKLVAAVKRRVNPGGSKEILVRPYAADQIEIIIPKIGEEELERLKRLIVNPGILEFRILANKRDNKDLIERALADPSKMKLLDSSGHIEAWWAPVKEEEVDSLSHYPDIALRERKKADGKKVAEVLLVSDDYNVTGSFLSRADADADQQGRPCLRFNFNSKGGQLFGQLTSTHLPDEKNRDLTYKLGIVLDGTVYSAPSIQSTIYNSGQITGTFTKKQVEDLALVLNAGSLPAKIRPVKK